MKKVINAGIGGRSFTINDDAYSRLESYLSLFRMHLKDAPTQEVMDDLESRIADLFYSSVGDGGRVVDLDLVEKVISQLGMPDGSSTDTPPVNEVKPVHKLYRDTDDVKIAGVCSGLALYFDIDTSLARILMLVALLAGSFGFWAYIILWILAPLAKTSAQKCELRGLPVTAENMARFSTEK